MHCAGVMVYVKFDLKFQVLKFHCNFTAISTPGFGLHAIRILGPRPVRVTGYSKVICASEVRTECARVSVAGSN